MSLTSWGRYPNHPQTPHRCHWRSDIAPLLASLKAEHGTTLGYGKGRSYGDSCLAGSDHVIDMQSLDRFIVADWEHGVIIAEAGLTLGEILDHAVPRGWFLPVTPGTRFVTLGGAVANDVHGKNHHKRGTFGMHVTHFGLVRSDQAPLTCSREENVELFAATIGGLGLTGIIEWVELRLMPITSNKITTQDIRFESLSEFLALSSEHDANHEYSVAWLDCLSDKGRGVLMLGDHASEGELKIAKPSKRTMPKTPFSLVNRLSVRGFNALYYQTHRNRNRDMGYGKFFYPLDGLLQWNRMYGRKGFEQYQCVIPEAAAPHVLPELLDLIAESGNASFLAVLKRCGNISSSGLLSFPMPGITLALDFPEHSSLHEKLFPYLDGLVRSSGGRLYPAKDAHMSGADFRAFYPKWEQVERLRDPALISRFWQRVTA